MIPSRACNVIAPHCDVLHPSELGALATSHASHLIHAHHMCTRANTTQLIRRMQDAPNANHLSDLQNTTKSHRYPPEAQPTSSQGTLTPPHHCFGHAGKYIDLYQLHFPTRDVPIFGAASFAPGGVNRPMPWKDELPPGSPGYDMFERQVDSSQTGPLQLQNALCNRIPRAQVSAVKRLIDAGLIKHWGLSNENAFGITMFCVAADKLGCPRPVSCQNVSPSVCLDDGSVHLSDPVS